MRAALIDRAQPADLRDQKQVTAIKRPATNVRVGTQRPWRREAFFRYLEREIAQADPPIPHLTRLAELAGLSPSTISYWKSGKQRPTLDKLAAIAKVLGKHRRELWLEAGLVEAGDIEADELVEVDPRLDGLDPTDPVVQHIMSAPVDEEFRSFALNRHRRMTALRRQQDIEELEMLWRRETAQREADSQEPRPQP